MRTGTHKGYVNTDKDAIPSLTGQAGKTLTTDGVSLSWGNSSGGPSYKVYTALLNQSGTDAPVAVVLENTLGITITYIRNVAGDYTATFSAYQTVDKVVLFINSSYGANVVIGAYINPTNGGTVIAGFGIETARITGVITDDDNLLINTSIEIRVYPA